MPQASCTCAGISTCLHSWLARTVWAGADARLPRRRDAHYHCYSLLPATDNVALLGLQHAVARTWASIPLPDSLYDAFAGATLRAQQRDGGAWVLLAATARQPFWYLPARQRDWTLDVGQPWQNGVTPPIHIVGCMVINLPFPCIYASPFSPVFFVSICLPPAATLSHAPSVPSFLTSIYTK